MAILVLALIPGLISASRVAMTHVIQQNTSGCTGIYMGVKSKSQGDYGRCCSSKCSGKREWHNRTIMYNFCQVAKGKVVKKKKQGLLDFSYYCHETCDVYYQVPRNSNSFHGFFGWQSAVVFELERPGGGTWNKHVPTSCAPFRSIELKVGDMETKALIDAIEA